MATFMDIHTGMKGITRENLEAEHKKDQQLEKAEGVHFVKAWADPKSGKVFCLSEGPNIEAVKRVHEKAGHPADEICEVSLTIE